MIKHLLRAIFLWLAAIGFVFAQTDLSASLIMSTPHASVSFSQKGEPVELTCGLPLDEKASYQWYKSESRSNAMGVAIEGANSFRYVTDAFQKKEIRFYYCVATFPDGVSKTSKTAVAAYTGLPIVKINTVNEEEPSADYAYAADGAYGRGITNATNVPASMQIIDSCGNLVYESGEYVKKISGLTIKLRGNTSAYVIGKSSYRLKLQRKADLLASLKSRSGKSFQDKEWILHKATSTLDTYIGFAVCDIAGVPWTPKFSFVNVFINNDYRGLFMLMEAINRNESRVDVSEDGYIIERDAYWWNESVKFTTKNYGQKFTFKYPDDDDITEGQLSYIDGYMNSLELHIADGSYDDYIDVESFARWLLIHDFLGSWDAAGSNIFVSKYDTTEKTKLRMLTNWDFDSNFMQEGAWSLQHIDDRIYMASMFKSSNRAFANMYKSLYDSLAPILWNALEKKLNEFNDALGEQIDLARYCEIVRWDQGKRVFVAYELYAAKKWFVSRGEWLKNAIENMYAVSYEMNGGMFESSVPAPDSINFLINVEIPQPRRPGYVFSGWTSELDGIPEKNFVLYGYNVNNDVRLTANWSLDSVYYIKRIDNDMSLNVGDLEGRKRFSVEIFSVMGKFMGRILLDEVNVHLVMKSLRNAGYANGVYILRSDALHKNFRVRLE